MEEQRFFILPGIYDCLGAKIAQDTGFQAVYLSGGAVSLATLGKPDLGYLSLSDLTSTLGHILACIDIPVITDADNAFGNAAHAANAASTLERLGVSGMQLDDDILPQEIPAREKQPIPWSLLAPKIQAIRKNVSDDFVLVLRTMLAKTEGIPGAIKRANMAADMGVDYVYFDGIGSTKDMMEISNQCHAKLMINLNEATYSAKVDINLIKQMGFRAGLYPVSSIQVAAKSYYKLFNRLQKTGSTTSLEDEMVMSGDILNLMGLQKIIEDFLPLYRKNNQ